MADSQFHYFQRGETVTHPRRPDWGRGVVKDARPIKHQGRRAQRLSVAFANKGRVVINTAVAPLNSNNADGGSNPSANRSNRAVKSTNSSTSGKGSETPMSPTNTSTLTRPSKSHSQSNGGGWLGQLERATGSRSHELWELGSDMTDPFASLGSRLQATLDSYRYSTQPRALIDWAVAQTGLDDPMTRYTRVELEEAFPRYARNRDQHLHDLIRQLKRKGDEQTLRRVQSSLRLPAAKSAMQKALRG